jgi:hypothetical protein
MTITATWHTVHPSLPSGFAFADPHQEAEFDASGSVHGASKVCLVRPGADTELLLAVRLRPPRSSDDIRSPLGRRAALESTLAFATTDPIEAARWYIDQYNLGWQASTRVGRTGQSSEAWDSGMTNYAWDDGYLDHAAGRPKWHLTYCSDHDACGEA